MTHSEQCPYCDYNSQNPNPQYARSGLKIHIKSRHPEQPYQGYKRKPKVHHQTQTSTPSLGLHKEPLEVVLVERDQLRKDCQTLKDILHRLLLNM